MIGLGIENWLKSESSPNDRCISVVMTRNNMLALLVALRSRLKREMSLARFRTEIDSVQSNARFRARKS